MLIGLVGFISIATCFAAGKSSRKSPSRCIYFSGKKIDPGRIAARPSEAGDEAYLDRVFGSNECDWYRLSRSFGGHGGYAPGRSDHADLPTSQVGGQFRELIESARQPIVDRNVLALDPAAFGKATAEGVQ